ncbi:MAG: acyl-CoA desaturase [Bacteroidia bacterium]|nr:acyl-CoA desaturase [Bacteroidia bacterium]
MENRSTFSQNRPEFSRELRRRVDDYFRRNNITPFGNWKIHVKAGVLLCSALVIYLFLIFDVLPLWGALVGTVLLGCTFASIGFNLMHEGAHGSYSKYKWLNEFMAFTLNVMGGNAAIWKQKHNNAHHTYTNVQGHDSDIDIEPWIRSNKGQKRRWYHRYQHIYGLFLYSFTYLVWVFRQDFSKYFTGKIAEAYSMRKLPPGEHLVFWLSKLLHFMIILVIPILMLGWKETLIGYIIFSLSVGFVLGIVFQLAHLVEETEFPVADAQGEISNEWTIHQLETTSNFSTRSKLMSCLLGGLNFQVEHHLFPKISHVHYPAVSRLVKEVCMEYNVRYNEQPTLYSALRSHLRYLRSVGNG